LPENIYDLNRFELIFDELLDGRGVKKEDRQLANLGNTKFYVDKDMYDIEEESEQAIQEDDRD
jgi:hypothetical protein